MNERTKKKIKNDRNTLNIIENQLQIAGKSIPSERTATALTDSWREKNLIQNIRLVSGSRKFASHDGIERRIIDGWKRELAK